MEVRRLGGRGNSRVDDNHLHAPPVIGLEPDVHEIRGNSGIGAEAQKHPGVLHVRLYHFRSGGALPGHDRGGKAGGGLTAVVHRAIAIGQPLEKRAIPLFIAAVKGRTGCAGFLPHGEKLPGDLLHGLIPGDGPEFSLALFADSFQGRLHPILSVNIVSGRKTPGAELPVVGGVRVGALHLDDFPVLHIAGHAAVWPGRADVAEGIVQADAGILAGELCRQPLFCGHDFSLRCQNLVKIV